MLSPITLIQVLQIKVLLNNDERSGLFDDEMKQIIQFDVATYGRKHKR